MVGVIPQPTVPAGTQVVLREIIQKLFQPLFALKHQTRLLAIRSFRPRMCVIGLTGGIATGKSTVSEMFRVEGFPVIDADLIARQVVDPNGSAYDGLRKEFGAEYFDDENGGKLMREKLGKLIFSNPEKRKRLNALTHPSIRWLMLQQFLWHFFTSPRYIVFDTPLLFESGYDQVLGKVIVVWCDGDKELDRLQKRDGLAEEDAKNRISSQMDIEVKKKKGSYVIDNNGSMDELRKQIELLMTDLKSSWTPLLVRLISLGAGILGVTFILHRLF